jgi:hypothetical protein
MEPNTDESQKEENTEMIESEVTDEERELIIKTYLNN